MTKLYYEMMELCGRHALKAQCLNFEFCEMKLIGKKFEVLEYLK